MAVAGASIGLGCLPDNPALLPEEEPPPRPTGPMPAIEGEILGCGDDSCLLVLVSQTLDDRLEIFAPRDPDGEVYRGAIGLDLVPNECPGCGLGDNGEGRLDEPFGLALTPAGLHVVTGHYPTPELGSLLTFPREWFADRPAGQLVPESEYFAAGAFSGVDALSLDQLEPIFVRPVADKLVIGTFNNSLIAPEETWSRPGKLLIVDPADPEAAPGVVDLDDLDGQACNGTAQVVELSGDRLAMACDGNEAIAVVDIPDLSAHAPDDAASQVGGWICPIPGATPGRRVRYLAADDDGGLMVADGPPVNDHQATAKLWRLDPESCEVSAPAVFGGGGEGRLGEVVALPGGDDESRHWLVASGSNHPGGERGVLVVEDAGEGPQVCGSIGGLDDMLDAGGEPLEPYALAVAPDGEGLAIGAGPHIAPTAGPGYGRVLWGELEGRDDPCTMTATVVDLTGGAPAGPAVDPLDPRTFRRAPNVVEVVEVAG